jgi:hypothetical protein
MAEIGSLQERDTPDIFVGQIWVLSMNDRGQSSRSINSFGRGWITVGHSLGLNAYTNRGVKRSVPLQ